MAVRGGKKKSGRLRSAARSRNNSSKVRSGGSFGGSGSARRSTSRTATKKTSRSRPASSSRSTTKTRGGNARDVSRKRQPASTSRSARNTRSSSVSPTQSPLRQRAQTRYGTTRTAPSSRTGTATRGGTSRRPRTARTTGGSTTGSANTAHLQQQINALQSRFSRLRSSADLESAAQNISRLDARLAELPLQLQGLRDRGYAHAGLLEEEIASMEDQWQQLRPRAERTLVLERNRLQRELATAGQAVNQLSPRNAAMLTTATNAVNSLQSQLNNSLSNVSNHYNPMLSQLNLVEQTVERFEWVLEQFDQSPGVRLRPTEAPLMAAEAEWERDGDEGPNGMLFLTDQRLLFEQNEEVAEEKLFGLFTTKSETVQRLLIDVPVQSVERVEHEERGGFLGMGKAEVLELILGPQAPVTRARFVLKDQDSADWAVWIKKAQTGDIDRDRSDEYKEEVARAEALQSAFPSNCPSCYAPLPPPQRGQNYVQCVYCGTVVSPDFGKSAEKSTNK